MIFNQQVEYPFLSPDFCVSSQIYLHKSQFMVNLFHFSVSKQNSYLNNKEIQDKDIRIKKFTSDLTNENVA